MFIPPELEKATLCGSGTCDLSRRAACEVIAPHSADPWYQDVLDNDGPCGLKRPSVQWDFDYMERCKAQFSGLLEAANPGVYSLEVN